MVKGGRTAIRSTTWLDQVPAKLYEYFRAGRPVLALTDPAGDTAKVMGRFGLSSIARLADANEIAGVLEAFVRDVRGGVARIADPSLVAHASRAAKAAELAALLDGLVAGAGCVSAASA